MKREEEEVAAGELREAPPPNPAAEHGVAQVRAQALERARPSMNCWSAGSKRRERLARQEVDDVRAVPSKAGPARLVRLALQRERGEVQAGGPSLGARDQRREVSRAATRAPAGRSGTARPRRG